MEPVEDMQRDMHHAARLAKSGLRNLSGLIWPQRSIVSGERHAGDGALLPSDFAKLTFLNGDGCHTCARPMTPELGGQPMCPACIAKPPRWDQARAAVAYDDTTRPIVLAFKHGGRRDGLKTMCNWMAMAGTDILETTDCLVPVPLHYRRLATRGFNQAGWLAQGVGRLFGRPVQVDALVRKKATPSQGGLSADQRKRNVAGAFAIRGSRKKTIQDATVTLVDDVYTTGSTLSACTLALKRAGAKRVNILVLARVVRDTDVTI